MQELQLQVLLELECYMITELTYSRTLKLRSQKQQGRQDLLTRLRMLQQMCAAAARRCTVRKRWTVGGYDGVWQRMAAMVSSMMDKSVRHFVSFHSLACTSGWRSVFAACCDQLHR
jgi:uncharacterized protein (DUF2252 family)